MKRIQASYLAAAQKADFSGKMSEARAWLRGKTENYPFISGEQVIEHLNKGFAHAKKELEALDASNLTGKRKVMGRDLSVSDIGFAIGGDLHEHLGQLIAYARTNHIVPPWSK